jgi:hypothetical protein
MDYKTTCVSTCVKKTTPRLQEVVKKMSGKRDSNPRPRPWQGRALPTELFPQHVKNYFCNSDCKYIIEISFVQLNCCKPCKPTNNYSIMDRFSTFFEFHHSHAPFLCIFV